MDLLAHTHHWHDSRTTKWKKLNNKDPNGFTACGINLCLCRWQIRAMYWYTAPSQYCPWFHNTSQRQFPIHPNVVSHDMPNKQSCTWRSLLSIMYQTPNTGGTRQTVFWHHHTLHQQLSLENSIAGTKNHTQSLQYFHTKNHHSYGHQTVNVGDPVQNHCSEFFVYQGSICTEDRDVIQKYISSGRKWENTSVRAITFLCKKSQLQKT
jgi:hypothetical protein